MADPGASRSSFGPVVILGLVSAGLAAVASAKPWLDTGAGDGSSSDASMTAVDAGTRYPLASAISLVLLASWGVLLVTRGRVRRAFAVLATLAAVALVVSVVVAYATLPDTASSSFDDLMGRGAGDTGFTGWFWTAAVCAVVAVVPAVLAARLVPGWPEMGSRYDAPGTHTPQDHVVESERDLWNELDEGRDPTDTGPDIRPDIGPDLGRDTGHP
jgi:uncharacterized membrane protein (TIGR02234 family)